MGTPSTPEDRLARAKAKALAVKPLVREIDPGRWVVAGEHAIYEVKRMELHRPDGSRVTRYLCDCPAATSGHPCYHAAAVSPEARSEVCGVEPVAGEGQRCSGCERIYGPCVEVIQAEVEKIRALPASVPHGHHDEDMGKCKHQWNDAHGPDFTCMKCGETYTYGESTPMQSYVNHTCGDPRCTDPEHMEVVHLPAFGTPEATQEMVKQMRADPSSWFTD